jgi:hypothetical protein
MRSDLTVTYGLRWQYYSVPYEINGFEATPSLDFRQFLTPRLQLGPLGQVGPLPVTTYSPAGKANQEPGLYEPDLRDFAPRLSFAYNPSAKEGLLGRVFGDRKTVIRGGGGVVFDHPVTNAFNFIQDQASYLFQNAVATNTNGDLATDFRFVDLATLPTLNSPPVVTPPFAPFVFNGIGPAGEALGQANYAIDPTIKTPYSITLTLGFQRELPGNFLLESTYFARLGRRLLVQADAGQVIDFNDPTSGHFLAADFADLSKQLRAGVNPQTTLLNQEPFFENQMVTANCQAAGFPSCTQIVGVKEGTLVERGDLGDTIQGLSGLPFFQGLPGLPLGLGLDNQFGTNAFITNQGSSSYNGLLTTLHKRLSHNFQFDFNYTYSHSMDNGSATANNVFGTTNFAGGLICDVLNLRTCRGNSEFDVTHIIGADGIWDIPVGRGQPVGGAMPRWLDETIGGWQLSGEDNWHSGFAFTSVSNAFPISFSDNAPAIFDGNRAAIRTNVHTDPASGNLQLFANPVAAQAAFSGPLGIQAGPRDNLRGPRFSNLNLGLAKHFSIREGLTMTFRADAFNVLNHPNFDLPGLAGNRGTADITNPGQFGVITGTDASRQMQFALRLDF